MTLKTTANEASVDDFLNSIGDEQKRGDCLTLTKLFQKITGQKGKMWGTSIIGFGSYTYTTIANKTYEMAAAGFSPRAQNLTIYTVTSGPDVQSIYEKLGTHKTSKACLYIKKLTDVDLTVLEKILSAGYQKYSGKHLDYKTGKLE